MLIVGADSGLTLEKVLKCDKTLNFGIGDPNLHLRHHRTHRPISSARTASARRAASRWCGRANHANNLLAVANGVLDVATNNTTALAMLNREAGRPEAGKVKVIWDFPHPA